MAPPAVQILAADGDLELRLLRDDDADYELMRRWLTTPHVKEWWDPDLPDHNRERVVQEYQPYTAKTSTTIGCIIRIEGDDAGYVQLYPWAEELDYVGQLGMTLPADAWGIDIFIGVPGLVGRGWGRRAVALACAYAVREHGASEVDLVTAQANLRAQAAYVAAGFTRVGAYLDTDTKDGERIPSWLMRWRP